LASDRALIQAAALLAAAWGTPVLADPGQVTDRAGRFVAWAAQAGRPARVTLTVQGGTVPLTIDSAGAKAVLLFTDRAGEPVPPPFGALATAVSSDTGVLTAGTARPGTDPASGVPVIEFPLGEVAAGDATLTVHVTDATGAPLLGPDAATPITDAPPVQVTVNPGAAAAERFTVPDA
jgi:hypothetical protein